MFINTSKQILICGQCNNPASLHNDVARVDNPLVCKRGEAYIHADREVTDTVEAYVTKQVPSGHKGVMPYVVDKSFTKSFQDYYATYAVADGWFYAIHGEHLHQDTQGAPARMAKDGLILSGNAEDRNLKGLGSDDEDNPNDLAWLRELAKQDAWTDGTYTTTADSQSWISTTVLGEDPSTEVMLTQFTNGKRTKHTVTDEPTEMSHSAYIEGFDGFSTIKVIDEELTLKHHERILNVYRKNGNLRVGSVEISYNTDGSVSATCVRNGCPCKQVPLTLNVTNIYDDERRSSMEQFVWSVICHGNNHAATWFTSRDSYYKVHAFNCDLDKCDNTTYDCKYVKAQPTYDEALIILAAYFNAPKNREEKELENAS